MYQLVAKVTSSEWGKYGTHGLAGKLAEENDPNQKIESLKPYSELWLGSHPTMSSTICGGRYAGEPLARLLKNKQTVLGNKNIRKYPLTGGLLPFTFKLISAGKALPLQVHPNLRQAKDLHQEDWQTFPDVNHKLKLVVALTRTEMLCGFRPRKEILQFLKDVPQLKEVLGSAVVDRFRRASTVEECSVALQKCVEALLQYDVDDMAIQLLSLVKYVRDMEDMDECTDKLLGKTLCRVHAQHPSDVGCLFLYFLNHVQLRIGEAVFVDVNKLHTVLKGDCLECSSLSENNVYAGFHPKPSDANTIIKLVAFRHGESDQVFQTEVSPDDLFFTTYSPTTKDFTIDRIWLPSHLAKYTLEPYDSGSLLLVLTGTGKVIIEKDLVQDLGESTLSLKSGSLVFIGAMQSFTIEELGSSLLMYRAYCNLIL